jgi:hypothetical protein
MLLGEVTVAVGNVVSASATVNGATAGVASLFDAASTERAESS